MNPYLLVFACDKSEVQEEYRKGKMGNQPVNVKTTFRINAALPIAFETKNKTPEIHSHLTEAAFSPSCPIKGSTHAWRNLRQRRKSGLKRTP